MLEAGTRGANKLHTALMFEPEQPVRASSAVAGHVGQTDRSTSYHQRVFDLRVFDRRSLNLLIGPPVPPSMTLWLLQKPDETFLLVENVLLSQRVSAARHAFLVPQYFLRERTLMFFVILEFVFEEQI